MNLMLTLWPEVLLVCTASLLFLMGIGKSARVRRMAPVLSVLALAVVVLGHVPIVGSSLEWASITATEMTRYVRLITAAVGILLVLLSWPTNTRGNGHRSLDLGEDVGEYFALLLLSLTGVMLVAGANDLITLFLAVELASIPTYIMVAVSRPQPAAKEAGVKYFYLGALAAALMLMGFTLIYGVTGRIAMGDSAAGMGIVRLMEQAQGGLPGPWLMVGLVLVILALCFKLAAVPLHVYAADVYQGAATPVTAVLGFVPKAVGVVALVKMLQVVGGVTLNVPPSVLMLLAVIAVATMTVGNMLALMQLNIKRTLAYSSVAHSGYLLVGVCAMVAAGGDFVGQTTALQAVLFYLAIYGLMNVGTFGVLAALPARVRQAATSAETYEDIAGQGRVNPQLGLAMAVCCLSLTGLPATVGFIGKVYLLMPALNQELYLLAGLLVLNSAIAATYYLKIVGHLFLRPPPEPKAEDAKIVLPSSVPARVAVFAAAGLILMLGTALPTTNWLLERAGIASGLDQVTKDQPVVPRLTKAD